MDLRLTFLAALLLSGCAGAGAGTTATATPSPSSVASPAPQAAASVAAPSPSPTCSGRATPAQTEGPYFKAGSPERTTLVDPGVSGTRLTVRGLVLTLDCKPVANAVLDFWQADSSGVYDNSGYRLRGHQPTDASGKFSLETVVPGEYPGRTQHIHVKVQAPGRPPLTTQLYFPGAARNQQDSIFDPALQMEVQDSGGGKVAAFNFVLDLR
jgi:protocatechuate 3,4-dioxygenase beta subunit